MKHPLIQRVLAWGLTLTMALSAVPFGVFAEGEGAECTCTVHCTAEAPDEACPVCAQDPAQCCVPEAQEDPVPQENQGTQENPGDPEGQEGQKDPDQQEPQEAPKAAAPQEGEGDTTCICAGSTKCTADTRNTDCPVCKDAADLDTACLGTAAPVTDNAAQKSTIQVVKTGSLRFCDISKVTVTDESGNSDLRDLLAWLTEKDPTPGEYVLTISGTIGDSAVNQANGRDIVTLTLTKTVDNNTVTLDKDLDSQRILMNLPCKAKARDVYGKVATNGSINNNKAEEDRYTLSTIYGSELEFFYLKTATVTFNGNGKAGEQISVPAVDEAILTKSYSLTGKEATRPGYTFLGWALTKDATKTDILNEIDKVTDNVTLYAVWQQVTITLKEDATQDGKTYTVDDAAQGQTLPTPQKEGYVFRGWADEQGNVLTTFDYTGGSKTLVAQWTKFTVSGNLEVDWEQLEKALGNWDSSQNPNWSFDSSNTTPPSEMMERIREAMEKLGHGDDDFVVKVFEIEVKRDGTPYPELPANIGFYLLPDGFEPQDLQVWRQHGTEIDQLPYKENGPENEKDECWYWENGKLYVAAHKFSTYAVAYVPFTVTFDANGGEVSPTTISTGTDGKLTAELPTPTRTGYTFQGWKNGTVTVDQNTVYTKNTTLTAEWTPITYSIVFDGNGGKLSGTVRTSYTETGVKYGETVKPSKTFTKDSYNLTGWAKDPEGTEPVGELRNLVAIQDGSITLYAQWTYDPYEITFDAQGGTITKNGQDVSSVKVNTQEDPINTVKATDIPVPNEREGYYFEGWYTQPDGKGDLVVPGGTNKATVFSGDTTVYAYWKAFAPVTVTLKGNGGTFTVNGQSVSTSTMQTKWPGTLDGTLPTAGRTGYKFEGWYTAGLVKVDENTVFLSDTTIYARWSRSVSRTGNPKTGDQIRLGLAVGIMAAAVVGLGAVLVVKKRKK